MRYRVHRAAACYECSNNRSFPVRVEAEGRCMVAGYYGDEDLYFRSTSYMFVVLYAQGKNGIRVSCMNSHNSCSSIGHT